MIHSIYTHFINITYENLSIFCCACFNAHFDNQFPFIRLHAQCDQNHYYLGRPLCAVLAAQSASRMKFKSILPASAYTFIMIIIVLEIIKNNDDDSHIVIGFNLVGQRKSERERESQLCLYTYSWWRQTSFQESSIIFI